MHRRLFIQSGSAAVVLLTFLGGLARGQSDTSPVRIIFPYVPGGTGDALARVIAGEMQRALQRPVIVENRSGANGRIGATVVKNAKPDGLTLLITPGTPMTLAPHYVKSLGYNPLTDFDPVTQLITFDYSIAVARNVSVQTMKDLVVWLKANPDKAIFGHPSAGGGQHFLGLILSQKIGIPLTPITYRGSAAALQDLLGGQIPILITLTSDVIQQARAGHIKVVATTGKERSRYFPEVPTLVKSGYDITGDGWFGLYAPAGTPRAIIDQYSNMLRQILHTPEIKTRLENMGFTPTGTSPFELAALQQIRIRDVGTGGQSLRVQGRLVSLTQKVAAGTRIRFR